jgi:type I site-specific restriction-modification system R (restriction) subunit
MLAVGADAIQCRDPFRADRERDARSRAARAVESWADPAIPGRLRSAIARINPQLPPSAVDEAVALVLMPRSQDLLAENHRLHGYLTKGIRSVVYTDAQSG